MKRTTASLAVILGLTILAAGIVVAQQDSSRTRGRWSAQRAPGAEQLLRMRKQLELTDEQITSLRALREDGARRRATQMTETMDIRSQLRAGDLTREEVRDRLEARRAAGAEEVTAYRERVGGVLTEDQRGRLQLLQRRIARRGGRSLRGAQRSGFRSPRRFAGMQRGRARAGPRFAPRAHGGRNFSGRGRGFEGRGFDRMFRGRRPFNRPF